MKYIKKHWFIITIIIICLIRFLLSFNLPSFFLGSLPYDDALMIRQSSSILNGNYLGIYNNMTLIKGPIFPFLLALIRYIHVSYSIIFTIIYIGCSLYFVNALKKIIKDKRMLIIILSFILFNPVTYSSELMQRLYRNVLSIPELLLFLGAIINVLFDNKHTIINNVFLGIITSIMLLTREDTLWTFVVLFFVYLYQIIGFLKNRRKTNLVKIMISLFPIFVIIINMNFVSLINYINYNTYTYNELRDTTFKKAYKKVLEIKDDEKIDKVAIPRSTFYKLAEHSSLLQLSKEDMDMFFELFQNENGEIDNGNVVWYFRNLVNRHNKFKDGKEARIFYNKLSIELDNLFEESVFEKEIGMPFVHIYPPTENELVEIPKSLVKTVLYTTSYDQVKTLTKNDIFKYEDSGYNEEINAYNVFYKDYRNSANIPKTNPLLFELIRIIYKFFTIILSPVAIFLYFKNIKKKDKINVLLFLILVSYITIILGISYNNATAFPSIRYSYLADIYILQNLFVLLNFYRLFKKNDIMK